jgi:hypothetical protein
MSWGGINRVSFWDKDSGQLSVRSDDMRGKGVGLVTHFVKQLLARYAGSSLRRKGTACCTTASACAASNSPQAGN